MWAHIVSVCKHLMAAPCCPVCACATQMLQPLGPFLLVTLQQLSATAKFTIALCIFSLFCSLYIFIPPESIVVFLLHRHFYFSRVHHSSSTPWVYSCRQDTLWFGHVPAAVSSLMCSFATALCSRYMSLLLFCSALRVCLYLSSCSHFGPLL